MRRGSHLHKETQGNTQTWLPVQAIVPDIPGRRCFTNGSWKNQDVHRDKGGKNIYFIIKGCVSFYLEIFELNFILILPIACFGVMFELLFWCFANVDATKMIKR